MEKAGIDPSITARALWLETHPLPANTHRWPEKRLDDIEDRAVNVDPLPVILGKPLALLQLGDDRQVPGIQSSRGFFLVIIDLTVGL